MRFSKFIKEFIRWFILTIFLLSHVMTIWSIVLIYEEPYNYPTFFIGLTVSVIIESAMIITLVESSKTILPWRSNAEHQTIIFIFVSSIISLGCYIAGAYGLFKWINFKEGSIGEGEKEDLSKNALFNAAWATFAPGALAGFAFLRSLEEVIDWCGSVPYDCYMFMAYYMLEIEVAIYGVIALVFGIVYSITSLQIAGGVLFPFAVIFAIVFKVLEKKDLICF